MSDRRNKREKEQLFNMPEIAKLEKKSFSGAIEKLEDSKLKKVLIWVFAITVTLIFAVLTSMMLFQSVTMQESSMEPTLAVGSRYFVNKLAYKASSPKRGDLIVFRTNASDFSVMHNLYFYNTLMQRIRTAIEAGEYETFRKNYSSVLDMRI